jgi:hypothetical protein
MKAQTLANEYLEEKAHEKWPVTKWTKFISITYFAESVLLFFVSFLLFFIKRTEETDPRLISGAFEGTTQLTFFVAVNLLAMITAVSGYYLFRFAHPKFETPEEFLRLYFKLTGVTAIPVFCLAVSVVIYLILR